MSEPLRWLVFACRTDYTVDVVEIIRRRGDIVGVLVDNLDDKLDGNLVDALSTDDPPVLSASDLPAVLHSSPTVIPLITPGHRHHVVAEATGRGLVWFPALVDPTSVVAASSTVGDGTVLNAATVLGGEVHVGRFVHVNRSASVGHHTVLEDFSTLGPACVLAGRVRIRSGAFIGAGAVCAPKVTIGKNAIVGAGAVVVRDVPDGAVVVGNPAQVIREGDTGYGGVRVP